MKRKHKRGRPKKSRTDKFSERIVVCVRPDDLKTIARAAENGGSPSMSRFISERILADIRRDDEIDEIAK